MAAIIERKRKDGTSAFLVQITIKRAGKIIHREAKTFDTRRKAKSWASIREVELDEPGALDRQEDPTLAEAIKRYERETDGIGRTKAQVLRSLRGFSIAEMNCSEIRSQDIVALARDLAKTREKVTVQSYMAYLHGVFEIARPAWGYPLDAQAMKDALLVAAKQGYTGRSTRRDRRPTVEEMNRLMEFFAGRPDGAMPMGRIAAFALYSARRQGEIVRLLWDDLDKTHSRILVRDMKDPRGAAGNHHYCDLTPEALRIIEATPRTDDRIFPFKGDTINVAWRDAYRVLGIDDLRFHDLRHEGVSRLFEMGKTIPQVAAVSGHRAWQTLQRYAHLRQQGDKWENWPWLDSLAAKGSD